MPVRTRLVAVMPSLLCAMAITPAWAEEPTAAGPAPCDGPALGVEVLMQRGLANREAQRDADALACFEKAVAEGAGAQAAVQRALAEQALGKWVDAYKHLGAALAGPSDPWVDTRRAPLSDALKEIERNVGKLEISVTPAAPSFTVRVEDNAPQAYEPPVIVPLGRVNVEVSAPGYEPTMRMLTILPGQLNRASVTLHGIQAAPPPPVPAASGATPGPAVVGADAGARSAELAGGAYNPWWFVMAGAGVVVAASALVPWSMGSSELTKLNDECPGGACAKTVYDDHRSKIESLDGVSTALLVSGSVIAVAGVTLGLVTRTKEAPLGAWMTPAGGGVAARGQF